jgi:hypothetical protein
MPNFTSRITAGATTEVWSDPATAEKPERITGNPMRPQRYKLVILGDAVTVEATVEGVEGPLDTELAGELFSGSFAEVPSWPAPAVSTPVGQSSSVTFTPTAAGHHAFVHRRANGGAVWVPFIVVEP